MSDLLTGGTLKITGDDGVLLGDATNGITLGLTGKTDTLTNLANYITHLGAAAGVGITASVDPSAGTQMTINSLGLGNTATPDVVAGSGANLPAVTTPAVTKAISLTDTPTVGATQSSQVGTLTLNAATDTFANNDTLHIGSQTITIQTGVNDTLTTLAAQINKGSYGVTATIGTGANTNVLTFNSPNSGMVFTGTSLTDATHGGVQVSRRPTPRPLVITASGSRAPSTIRPQTPAGTRE